MQLGRPGAAGPAAAKAAAARTATAAAVSCRAPRCSSRPRCRVSDSKNEPSERFTGVQRGPVHPAEVVEPDFRSLLAAQQQEQQEALQSSDEFLILQSAISKTHRAKLLEFRRTMTPELVENVRASLPPQHRQDLEQILREVSELGEDDEDGEGLLDLTPEEEAAWAALQDPSVPADFLRCETVCRLCTPRIGAAAPLQAGMRSAPFKHGTRSVPVKHVGCHSLHICCSLIGPRIS